MASDKRISTDLVPFGLEPKDIDARPLQQVDLARFGLDDMGISGYRVPYFNIDGTPAKHDRIRQYGDNSIPGDEGKFIRISKDITRVYFPPKFSECTPKRVKVSAIENVMGVSVRYKPLFIVDDERVAVQLTNVHGYLAVAIQGPSGWQTNAALAEGFKELCEKITNDKLTVVIWIGDGSDRNIQREAANLAMEIKFQGVPFRDIRQYKESRFSDVFLKQVLLPPSLFPQHPNIRQYIQDKIGDNSQTLSRKDHMEIGLAILADMESRGSRIKSTASNDFYYFNRESKELVQASLAVHGRELMANSDFMASIYTNYGLSPNDGNILRWFSTQFMAEEPILRTTSYRTIMCEPRQENTFAIQVTPSEFVYFGDNKTARICDNGDHGILFERMNVPGVDVDKLKAELDKQRRKETLPMWWMDVVKEVRLNKDERFRMYIALLYYVSPWLKGWRETQLPIEVITGEAGTGKSSLFSIRLGILTGDPELQGLPDSVRGWHTAVANTSGICVFDNVHLANKVHRQSISDEMCRLVTEPKPTIAMRQLYKTADMAKMPVNCTFALTSIENVFTNIDFIQRSVIMHLDRPYTSEEVLFGGWVQDKLQMHGGREGWLAHHIVALERFFALVEKEWDVSYKSKTRLINFEQCLVIMAKVFGVKADWLPELMRNASKQAAIEIDWVLEGLSKFAEHKKEDKNPNFTATEIVDWASCQEDFDGNATLTNARRLGRYISTHKTVVRQTTNIIITSNARRGSSYALDKSTIQSSPATSKAISKKGKTEP